MTGFFNPQGKVPFFQRLHILHYSTLHYLYVYFYVFTGFLTAMRQEVTRMHKGWALDTVTLHNEVLRTNKEEITAPPNVNFTL